MSVRLSRHRRQGARYVLLGWPPRRHALDRSGSVAGASVAATGRFFVDGQIRGEYYQNSLNPIVAGIFNQKLDAGALV
jgi:hypothetical protein